MGRGGGGRGDYRREERPDTMSDQLCVNNQSLSSNEVFDLCQTVILSPITFKFVS